VTSRLDQFFSSERLSDKEVTEDELTQLYPRLRDAAHTRFHGPSAAPLHQLIDELGRVLARQATPGELPADDATTAAEPPPPPPRAALELLDGIERLADALLLSRRDR